MISSIKRAASAAVFLCFLAGHAAAADIVDITPPVLADFDFTPRVVDSNTYTGIEIRVTVTDDLSGVLMDIIRDQTDGLTSFVTFRSPSGKQWGKSIFFWGNFHSSEGTDKNCIFKINLSIPEYSEPGEWVFEKIVIYDNVLNKLELYTWQIAAMGFPTKLTVLAATNAPPVARAGPDQVVYDIVTLDGSASFDSDGSIASWLWAFRPKDHSIAGWTVAGETVTYNDIAPGHYEVVLTVTDDGGAIGQDCLNLSAAGPATGMAGDADRNNKIDMADIIVGLQIMSGHRQ